MSHPTHTRFRQADQKICTLFFPMRWRSLLQGGEQQTLCADMDEFAKTFSAVRGVFSSIVLALCPRLTRAACNSQFMMPGSRNGSWISVSMPGLRRRPCTGTAVGFVANQHDLSLCFPPATGHPVNPSHLSVHPGSKTQSAGSSRLSLPS